MTGHTDTSGNMPMTAFLMGSLLGIAAGLLFAPKSGRESREMLRITARDNYNKMQAKAKEARENRKAAMAAADETVYKAKDTPAPSP